MHDIAQMLRMAAGGEGGQVTFADAGYQYINTYPAAPQTLSVPSGTAAAGRILVAAVMVRDSANGTTPTTTTMTIAGVTAQKIAGFGAGDSETSLWFAVVPSGTTATVVVNIDRPVVVILQMLAVYGAIPTPVYTAASAPTSGGGDITGVRKGVVIAATAQAGSCFNTGNVTDLIAVSMVSPESGSIHCAWTTPTTTGTVSPLTSGTSGQPYVAVSFAPT